MWVISNDPLWLHSHTQQLWLHWFFTEMQSELKGSMMPCSVIQRVLELGTSLLTGYGTVNILLFSCSVHSAHSEVDQLGVPFPSLVFIDVLFRPCKCFEVNWQWIPSYQWLACHSSNLNSSCIAQMHFFKFYRLILEGNPSGYRWFTARRVCWQANQPFTLILIPMVSLERWSSTDGPQA